MAEIDRGTSKSKGHKGSKLLRILMATSVIVVLLASSISLLSNPSEIFPVPAGIAYSSHGNITILGDAGFLKPNASTGISRGSGSASDPYTIEGWDISAASNHGINIQGTAAHFVIRDCYMHNGGGTYNGIRLSAVKNGTISNNTCSYNAGGIYLYPSTNNNTLTNNKCSYNTIGIYLYGYPDSSSNNNDLTDNNCSNNAYGIGFISSTYNTLTNNTCNSNTQYGVYFDLSSNKNTLTNNTCNSNNVDGIWIDLSNNNTLTNNTCSANGDDGIYLYTSQDNTLINNTCSSNYEDGVVLRTSGNNNNLTNNNFSNNWEGMYIMASRGNTISWNRICNNSAYGAFLNSASRLNYIWNNTFIGNDGSGAVFDPAHTQAYDDGTNNRWNTSGSPHGYGNYWSDLTSPDVAPPDGIVDWSYNLTTTTGAKDFYPLTAPALPIPEFSEIVIPIVGLMLIALIFGRMRKKP